MSTYIFGMAKSSLDTKGGKGRNLELDVLRLIYAINYYEERKEKAIGYLLVMEDKIKVTVIEWLRKYDFNNMSIDGSSKIDIHIFKPKDEEENQKINKHKDLSSKQESNRHDKSYSIAKFCEEITEKYLGNIIEKLHDGSKNKYDDLNKDSFPGSVRWDYYDKL